jgi:hypothetical protein
VAILQAIRADQISESQDRKLQHEHLTRALSEQSTTVNRLASELTGVCFRVTSIEAEQQKTSATLATVKERQDGCAARITHAGDSTEIRELRAQLQRAVSRQSDTPPRGVLRPRPSAEDGTATAWVYSRAGKAVLTALAALIVAALGAFAPWTLPPTADPQTMPARPPARLPVRPEQPTPADEQETDDGALGGDPSTSYDDRRVAP